MRKTISNGAVLSTIELIILQLVTIASLPFSSILISHCIHVFYWMVMEVEEV